jgi:hypothetical protein
LIQTRTLVRAEAIITQLVFEHALRIRVKAEAPSDPKPSSASDTSTINSPVGSDNGSEAEADLTRSQTTDATLQIGSQDEQESDAQSAKSVSSSTKSKTQDKPRDEGSSSPSNLIGKINNLVTTDLGNIVDSRDFLYMVLYTPVQIVVGMFFLYTILGWRCGKHSTRLPHTDAYSY